MAEEEWNSLEYTPTWIVAVVCSIIVLISLAAERGLHRLGKFLKRKDQESLFEALQKIKEELMLLGFISLLLTVFQGFIGNLCIPEPLTSYMLPCPKETAEPKDHTHNERAFQHSWSKRRLLSGGENANHCAKKGKAQFMSLEALHQLHIFIFVLAVVYVVFCVITMILGGIKVRKWKHWEDSIQREISKSKTESNRVNQIHARHHREFSKQRKGYSTIVSLLVSFFKQFYGSVTKSDYIALRHGFIMTHCPSNPRFDFHKYMMRTLEYDFKKVVGISWFLWVFVVLFLLLNMDGWHSYFYLSFLPLILLLVVGAKLEYIITCLADEIEEKEKENNGGQSKPDGQDGKPGWVKPSDKHFWFGRPSIVLYLIHFILFQNSFEIAFFFWVMVTYGFHSCIFEKIGLIIPRLIVGVIVQVLCSYSTLPLYTIVTQMGSMFKEGIFGPMVHDLVDIWAGDARERLHGSGLSGSNRIEMQNTASELREVVPVAQETAVCLERGDLVRTETQ